MKNRRLFILCALLCLLFNLWSRYAAAPVVDHSSDTWTILSTGLQADSLGEILSRFTDEIDRPVGTVANISMFYLIGDNPFALTVISVIGYSIHLLLCLGLVFRLSGRVSTSLIFGLLFSVLPIVFETYQWGMMIGVVYMEIFYVLCAYLWISYLRTNKMGFAVAAALFHVLAVASYEFGIALPAVLFLLVPFREWTKKWVGLIPFVVTLSIYLTWRFTDGFGQAEGVFFSSREPVIALWSIAQSTKEIFSWWLGSKMGLAILNGLNAFRTLPVGWRSFLVIANITFILTLLPLLAACLRRDQSVKESVNEETPAEFPLPRLLLFSLAWMAAGHLLSLFSWTAPRINLLPSIGAIFFVSLLLSRLKFERFGAALAIILFIGLLTNQGNSKAWKDVGIFNRNIYNYLEENQERWADKKLLYMDFGLTHHRTFPGLLTPVSNHPSVVPNYHNATLWRGFVTSCFVHVIREGKSFPDVAMSSENGGEIKDGVFYWYGKYTPSDLHSAPRDEVFIVDALSIGAGYSPKHFTHDADSRNL